MTENKKFDAGSVIETVKSVITNPIGFYQSMERTGGYVNPLIFVVAMGLVSGAIGAVLSFFSSGPIAGMSAGIGLIIFLPIAAVIGSFIGAAIMFVIWKLMGSEQNYETAYRCIAFSSAVFPIMSILSLVPYLGTLVGNIWVIWLMIIASEHVHQIEKKKALIVFGILGLLVVSINISGERTQRRFESQLEQLGEEVGNLEDMTPEEAGKALGEFMKGLQDATKEE